MPLFLSTSHSKFVHVVILFSSCKCPSWSDPLESGYLTRGESIQNDINYFTQHHYSLSYTSRTFDPQESVAPLVDHEGVCRKFLGFIHTFSRFFEGFPINDN